jgi:TrmH family RNA methyltransferase
MTAHRDAPRVISSRDNPAFREIAGAASSARDRRRAGVSFIEGIHLCQAYRHRHGVPLAVIHTEAALADPEVAALVQVAADRRLQFTEALFREISQLENGVGLAYLVQTPAPVLAPVIDTDTVVLDRIQDPGNVGAILRSAAGAGIGRVISTPGTAFCWSPKVLRAGMGAHFVLDIHESVPWELLAARVRIAVLATAGRAAASLWTLDLCAPTVWVFGNEGGGVDPGIIGQATHAVRIDQAHAVESLNVAGAAAVCLFEQRRQRLGKDDKDAKDPKDPLGLAGKVG